MKRIDLGLISSHKKFLMRFLNPFEIDLVSCKIHRNKLWGKKMPMFLKYKFNQHMKLIRVLLISYPFSIGNKEIDRIFYGCFYIIL